MKNWFDLNKSEQIRLINEFNSKNKISDLRIPLYIFAFFWFFIFMIPAISLIQGNEYSKSNAIIFGVIFIIFLLIAIINSLKVSKHQKEFEKWLKARNIDK